LNGPLHASIVLVGEAPGRLGADRTGIPFSGDESGRRLDRLLAEAGWRRDEVFLTNAVLCNPRGVGGLRNRPPSNAELRACQGHLAATLDCLRPRLVIALGRRALIALHAVEPHQLQHAEPGVLTAWQHGYLTWMLHPSPLTQATRPWATQCADWQRLRRAAAPVLR
jgi:uracil-DNA glycosylase family 4